jgi:D-alanyl-D-alanine dipeptidase
MRQQGFVPLPTEWWHFDDAEWRRYGVLDVPL